jgi:DNA polymerase-3 subunit alpha
MKSHYSHGKAILTLNSPSAKLNRDYPISVFDIAKEHSLDKLVVVDDSIGGFLEGRENAKKGKIQYIYGLKLRCMENIEAKSDASLKTIHKIIVFVKNDAGYQDLIKISSLAAKKGFYYKPNIDFPHLKELWSDNLILGIPFYDSFLFANTLYGHLCVPSFTFAKPTFFIESSDLPFDALMQEKVLKYAQSIGADVELARSIYYYKRDDYLAYLAYRCISERTLLEKPELEHCSSSFFSFEKWQEQNDNPEQVRLT